MDKFKQLGIAPEILKSLEEMKFTEPTEIQEKAIPLVVQGKDIIAGAATGSGKTLAFGAGIIHNCERQGIVQSLVLVPTRELADQVARSLKVFSKHKPLEIVEVYGGVSMGPQVQKLRRADVVVGTPGRILDHIEHETIELGYVKILVLDEADRMLDMGFIRDVRKIIQRVPQKRQTMLFSATISREIRDIVHEYMSHPTEVFAETQVDPSKLTQIYYDVEDNMKFSLLVHLVKNDPSKLVMVFCNTQRNTDFVARNLQNIGINALAIHGGYSQDKRTRTMEKFHSGNVHVLVCTDVAARGLDIKGVSHVYNYDVPNEPSQYVHRIGRTARAGHEGKAVTILASRDYENFVQVKRKTGLDIKREETPMVERVSIGFKNPSRFEERSHGRFGGDRGFRRHGGFGERRNFDRREGREERDEDYDDNRGRRSGGFSRGRNFGGRRSGGFSRSGRHERRENRGRFFRR